MTEKDQVLHRATNMAWGGGVDGMRGETEWQPEKERLSGEAEKRGGTKSVRTGERRT